MDSSTRTIATLPAWVFLAGLLCLPSGAVAEDAVVEALKRQVAAMQEQMRRLVE